MHAATTKYAQKQRLLATKQRAWLSIRCRGMRSAKDMYSVRRPAKKCTSELAHRKCASPQSDKGCWSVRALIIDISAARGQKVGLEFRRQDIGLAIGQQKQQRANDESSTSYANSHRLPLPNHKRCAKLGVDPHGKPAVKVVACTKQPKYYRAQEFRRNCHRSRCICAKD